MSFVVYYSRGNIHGYVRKHDGMNDFLADPRLATRYDTAEEAHARGQVGHHSDMGGSGFFGRAESLRSAIDGYKARQRRRGRY
jgi:hypothetical protein